MRWPVLLLVALAVPAEGLRAQVPGVADPLGALLGEPPRTTFASGLAVLGCCGAERRLDARVGWPASPRDGFGVALVGALVSSEGDLYSRSGLELRLDGSAGGLALSAAVSGALGTGAGPRQVVSMLLGAGWPALSLNMRTTWFQEASDSARPRGVPRLPGGDLVEGAYTDAELEARHRLGGAGLLLTTGARFGGDHRSPPAWLWGEVDMPVWRRVSVVVGGGARPERRDLSERGGHFATFGLRVDLFSPAPDAVPVPPDVSGPPALAVVPLGPARYRLRVRVAGARTVELTGDLLDWAVRPMSRAATDPRVWTLTVRKPPGTYHVNIRLDGGDWIVPAGLVAVPDRFGGSAGLLTLPEARR